MLPHKHFAIAGLVIAPAALLVSPAMSALEIIKWVFACGLVSAMLDLDITAFAMAKARKSAALNPFKRPRNIFRKFDQFMAAALETGILKKALITHLLSSAAIVLIFYFYGMSLFIPVSLGVISHLASDIPNYRRAFR